MAPLALALQLRGASGHQSRLNELPTQVTQVQEDLEELKDAVQKIGNSLEEQPLQPRVIVSTRIDLTAKFSRH